MKKYFLNFMMAAVTVAGLATSACTTDLCKNVDCGTHGSCDEVDGSCACDAGYETDTDGKCNTEGRAKFVGSWRGNDNGATTPAPYTLTVTSLSTDVTKLKFTNFANSLCSANDLEATGTVVKGTDGKYASVEQFSTDCSGVTVNTTTKVTVSGTTMTVTYNFSGGGTNYSYTDVLIKQ